MSLGQPLSAPQFPPAARRGVGRGQLYVPWALASSPGLRSLPGGTCGDGDSRLNGPKGSPAHTSSGTTRVPWNRATAPEEVQGETLNYLRLFHTPARMRDKTHKIKLGYREVKNVMGLPQLSWWGETLTHLGDFHWSGGQMRGFMDRSTYYPT